MLVHGGIKYKSYFILCNVYHWSSFLLNQLTFLQAKLLKSKHEGQAECTSGYPTNGFKSLQGKFIYTHKSNITHTQPFYGHYTRQPVLAITISPFKN